MVQRDLHSRATAVASDSDLANPWHAFVVDQSDLLRHRLARVLRQRHGHVALQIDLGKGSERGHE